MGGPDMKNVIENIAMIDAAALKNEQQNKAILVREKQRYEIEINKYREQKLKAAESSAKSIYSQITGKAQSEYQEKEAQLKKKSWQLKNNYMKVEDKIINDFFDKLFEE